MAKKLVVHFAKMNGAGNDFVVIDNRFYHFSPDELVSIARRWCPRRTGVGADGLLVFEEPEEDRYDYRMRYYNSDGSVGTMCGNGARCLARFARDAGMEGEELRFESDAGVYRAHVPADPAEGVRLFVQPPRRFQRDVRLKGEAAEAAGLSPLYYIWPGVEHVVCFVDDVDAVPVDRLGRVIRRDQALAPAGANVNFAEVRPDGELKVRTFEKGVEGETLACGTGALASGIVASLEHKTESMPVRIEMPGGVLTVGFDREGEELTNVFLEGPALIVFRGTLELDPETDL